MTDLLTAAELAQRLGSTEGALAQWRYKGLGPKFIKPSPRKVLYRWSDVEAWLDAQTRTITGDGVRA